MRSPGHSHQYSEARAGFSSVHAPARRHPSRGATATPRAVPTATLAALPTAGPRVRWPRAPPPYPPTAVFKSSMRFVSSQGKNCTAPLPPAAGTRFSGVRPKWP